MIFLTLTDFLGRFHPLLVHLPIGILLLAVLFQWMLLVPRWASLKPAIPVMFFWGTLAAAFSCITGYFLSLSGEYDADTTSQHQWMGIYTAIASLLIYFLHRIHLGEWITRIAGLIILVLISITGHLGGTLTHGEGYLTQGLGGDETSGPVFKSIADINQATVYSDLVQPVLQSRCYSCHGSTKQKGKLRLDEMSYINQGGKSGKTVIAGNAEESELIKRMLLPLNDDDHMPPKEKPQPTQAEIDLLHWWVQNGADFKKKVNELPQDDKIKSSLAFLQSGTQAAASTKQSDWPTENVSAADEKTLQQLKDAGVMIFPVAANSNYLQANFYTVRGDTEKLLELLTDVKKQLVWLKLDGIKLGDNSMKHIAELTSLRRLHLSNTEATDAGLAQLQTLVELRSLNLFATKVTAEGLQSLSSLKKLESVYLYQTGVTGAEYTKIKEWLPTVRIDTGGYHVPTFETDTTELTY